jgi:hypothetical protein
MLMILASTDVCNYVHTSATQSLDSIAVVLPARVKGPGRGRQSRFPPRIDPSKEAAQLGLDTNARTKPQSNIHRFYAEVHRISPDAGSGPLSRTSMITRSPTVPVELLMPMPCPRQVLFGMTRSETILPSFVFTWIWLSVTATTVSIT